MWAGGSVKSVGDEIAERSSKRGGREGGGTQRMLGVDITYNSEGRGLRLALKRNMIVFRALSCGKFCSNEIYKP